MSSNEHTATPVEVQNGNGGCLDGPAEYTAAWQASPTNSAGSSAAEGRRSFQSHGRTLSMAADALPASRSNRFSIQFPIQSATSYAPSTRASIPPVRERPFPSSDPAEAPYGPLDANYLHLIAAQERKVLELKEELERAEGDLNRLKRDWARHEATKKRQDARRITRLQPLQTSLPATDKEDDVDGSSAWMQQEMERRKALMSASRTSTRTVFSGQRHTRTLSLLSPRMDKGIPISTPQRPPPPRNDSLKNPARQSIEDERQSSRLASKSRASTISDMPRDPARTAFDAAERGLDHDALLRAGKKVATDFKDGLWSFWEEVRQATVGEENVSIPPPRKKSSTQTLKTAQKQNSRNSLKEPSKTASTASRSNTSKKTKAAAVPATGLADPSFWTDHGIPAPPAASHAKENAAMKTHTPAQSGSSTASNEGWDTWDDSPVQSRSSSSVTSENTTLPSTVSGSPRQSMSTNRDSRDLSKKEAIPWPVLKKSTGLGTLRRTASHLLSEWEKSLTPSPGQDYTGHEDYMTAGAFGASAEAAAYAPTKGKND